MLYTKMTKKAMKFAYDAHHGQLDPSGVPYVFHPFTVAEMVSEKMPEEIPVCVALLHDVVEDTEVTQEQLEVEFSKEVAELVGMLTHDSEEDYFDYVQRIKENPIAAQIKAMDIRHNMNENRLSDDDPVPEEKRKWWKYKYAKALEILEAECHVSA